MSSLAAVNYNENVPIANLNLDFEIHRLFTFPLRLFRGHKFELLRKLAKKGFYYDHERGCARPFYCAVTISAEILSQDIKDAEKIISERLLQSNCDISRNVPTGNVDGGLLLNYEFEAHRLLSLLKNIDHFPDLNIYEVAKSGFFYFGEEDKVMCDFCDLTLHQWKEREKPDEEHLLWSPDCPFLLKDIEATTLNIPIGSEQIDSFKTDAIGIMTHITANPNFVPADCAAGGHFPHQVQEFLSTSW